MHPEASAVIEREEPSEFKKAEAQPEPAQTVVLLVEDNPGDARLIQLMLSEAGGGLFQIEQVDRLERGLERLTEGGIGIVLLDLFLPDSHGLQTFSRVHAAAPDLPIIVLSGLDDTTVAVQAVHEGAQDFLVKGHVEGQLLARSMRYAIERKRMTSQLARYTEELRNRNAQLQADFNMAREIQEIFLPSQYPTFPHSAAPADSALRFWHRYLPAAAVGGDFFDVFPITDTTGGLFICDVMGHGMRAALVTAIMRGLVEELRPMAADAGKFLTEIHRSLHAILRRTREPFLSTAFYLVADAANGELRFASAGHPSPVLVRRHTGNAEFLKTFDPRHGPALGLFSQALYPTCQCQAMPGDLLLFYTDGLFEAEGPGQEEYGEERLLSSIRQHSRLPAEELLDALLADVRRFSKTDEFEDDVCLVGMEIERLGVG